MKTWSFIGLVLVATILLSLSLITNALSSKSRQAIVPEIYKPTFITDGKFFAPGKKDGLKINFRLRHHC